MRKEDRALLLKLAYPIVFRPQEEEAVSQLLSLIRERRGGLDEGPEYFGESIDRILSEPDAELAVTFPGFLHTPGQFRSILSRVRRGLQPPPGGEQSPGPDAVSNPAPPPREETPEELLARLDAQGDLQRMMYGVWPSPEALRPPSAHVTPNPAPPPSPRPSPDEERLKHLEDLAEEEYDLMYDVPFTGGVNTHYSEAKELFATAIQLAREMGRLDDVARLEARLAHIKAVFHSQFP